jgi:uncharacterized protein YecT (DUF1311 family)
MDFAQLARMLLLLPLLFTASLQAADSMPTVESHYSAAFQECVDASLATADRLFCAQSEIARQQSRMNSILASAGKRLTSRQRTALRSSQAAWESKASEECATAGIPDDSDTILMEARDRCLLEQTVKRILYLEHRR